MRYLLRTQGVKKSFFRLAADLRGARDQRSFRAVSNKVPLVKNPQKFGRDASAELANKFSDARAFGYYCGRSNGITVLDVDTTDERVLADAMSRHGQTPIVVRTGSGKFHALYRHNNERRMCAVPGKGCR